MDPRSDQERPFPINIRQISQVRLKRIFNDQQNKTFLSQK